MGIRRCVGSIQVARKPKCPLGPRLLEGNFVISLQLERAALSL